MFIPVLVLLLLVVVVVCILAGSDCVELAWTSHGELALEFEPVLGAVSSSRISIRERRKGKEREREKRVYSVTCNVGAKENTGSGGDYSPIHC
ncbi:hypothetical protein BDF14DRAFT_1816121 [Spinellus fusiger]|nr:hypothetical protein BDF14DRAFT_1816121 [Spinellus fusiger]